MIDILQIASLQKFKCLGDACEDTCCKNWGMQIDPPMVAKYEREAPELLAAVDGAIMKRDACSDFCVKYTAGICAIHRDYGEDFLGDACNFFPRATRQMGQQVIMSAALSCPEIVRLSVINDVKADEPYYVRSQTNRLPHSLKNYGRTDLSDDDAIALHQILLQHALAEEISAEQALMNINVVLEALAMQPPENWLAATPMYLKMADSRIARPKAHIADSFNLFNVLAMLAKLTKNNINPRLQQTISNIATALQVQFDEQAGTLHLGENSATIWLGISEKWCSEWQFAMQPTLKKWLAAEISLNFFPFGGLGNNFAQRYIILCLRYSITRLAIIAHHINHHTAPNDAELVFIIQSIARFLDHLSNGQMIIEFCEQSEWNNNARLNGLLMMQ